MGTPDPEKQEDLVTEAAIDPMDQEQTFPDEDDIKNAEEELKNAKNKNKFNYRSGWIEEEEIADEFLDEYDEEKETKGEIEDLDDLVNKKNPNNTKNRVTFGEDQVFNMDD